MGFPAGGAAVSGLAPGPRSSASNFGSCCLMSMETDARSGTPCAENRVSSSDMPVITPPTITVPQRNWTRGGACLEPEAPGSTNRATSAVRARTSAGSSVVPSSALSNSSCTESVVLAEPLYCCTCRPRDVAPSVLLDIWSLSEVGLNWTLIAVSGTT